MQFDYKTNADTNHRTFQADYLLSMHEKFKNTINDEKYGFFHLSSNHSHITNTKEIFEKYKNRKYFVQIGIGGSALGPQMLIDALGKNTGTQFIWLDNTDAEYIQDELNKIKPKEAVFYVVSKSGGTAETMAAFAICRSLLVQAGIKEEEFNNYFVFCTDPIKSDLRDIANDEGYDALEVPSNIGGRFSVLTAVGLFPALFAGIDIEALYKGANEFKVDLLKEDIDHNPLLQSAAHLAYLLNEEQTAVNQTILMPYSSKLKSFSHWFVQLWGESLGKYSSAKKMNTGLTPIPAYGATDQHSQMQLFMEGPNDKLLFLVEIKNKKCDFKLDNSIDKSSATKLKGYTVNQLIEAQFHGTLQALADRKRNVIHLTIDKNNEYNLGAMIIFFESLTAMMGHYLLVDPFDQPGVELGKKYAFEYLKNSPQ
jgi:glucose-6-phosphate isomerase